MSRETFCDTMRGLEKNERARLMRKLRETLAAFAATRRQEALETEARRRDAGDAERRSSRRWAGYRAHIMTRRARCTHEFITRVGQERGTGIADERDDGAGIEPRHQFADTRRLVVFVQ